VRLQTDAVQHAHHFEMLPHRIDVSRSERMFAQHSFDVSADFDLRRRVKRIAGKRRELRRHVRRFRLFARARANQRDDHGEQEGTHGGYAVAFSRLAF
jgi:hypothetical protein